MASLFPTIYDVIDKNPSKHTTLRCSEPISTEGSAQWDQFSVKPLDPPGALSVLLIQSDPMYELGSTPLRKQILVEHLLLLHERVDKELIGRRYPRKKIQDLLATEVSAQTPKSSTLLEEVLCELFHVQKVVLNRRAKTIQVYPPDLRTWSSEKPIVFAEEDNCWIFKPLRQQLLVNWFMDKETDGWTIAWPTADAKFEDLKMEISQRNLCLNGGFKGKKDDAARIVGRAQAIANLATMKTC